MRSRMRAPLPENALCMEPGIHAEGGGAMSQSNPVPWVIGIGAVALIVTALLMGEVGTFLVVLLALAGSLSGVLAMARARARAARRRRHPETVARRPPQPPLNTRIHRLGNARAAWMFAVLFGTPLAAIAVALAWEATTQPGLGSLDWRQGTALWGLVATVGGLALWLLLRPLWVSPRHVWVKAAPGGLELHTAFRHIEIPWDDVVSLSMAASNVGTRYTVYGTRRTIVFLDAIEDARELAEQIARATGLDWTGT